MGSIVLRLHAGEHETIRQQGHVGYLVKPAFRGHHYASRGSLSSLPNLFISYLNIMCNDSLHYLGRAVDLMRLLERQVDSHFVSLPCSSLRYANRRLLGLKLLLPFIWSHGLNDISVIVERDNVPSQKVCERLGGKVVREIEAKTKRLVYSIPTILEITNRGDKVTEASENIAHFNKSSEKVELAKEGPGGGGQKRPFEVEEEEEEEVRSTTKQKSQISLKSD